MEIKIETGEELNLLLEALKTEIINANSYHRLFCGLLKSRPAHEREFQQSEVFWYLTQNALQTARLINLCRVSVWLQLRAVAANDDCRTNLAAGQIRERNRKKNNVIS
jgi:hypothetical protein